MKCKHCQSIIEKVEVHLVYFKDLNRIYDANDLYDDYDYFDETIFCCPECKERLKEDEIIEE